MARRKVEPTHTPPAPPLDEQGWQQIGRYWREIGGTTLLLFAILCLLNLPNWTQSSLLGYFTTLLKQIFGWQAALVLALIALVGASLALRWWAWWPYLQTRTAGLIGVLILSALPLTHILQGATYEEAYAGNAGGLLGWAFSLPLQLWGGLRTLFLLYLITAIVIFCWHRGYTRADVVRWLVWMAGRLQFWAEQLLEDPDEEPVRTLSADELPVKPTSPRLTQARLRAKEGLSENRPKQYDDPLPLLHLLEQGEDGVSGYLDTERCGEIIIQTLQDFGLDGQIVGVQQGPTITQFGLEPGFIPRAEGMQKVRVAQIANLRADLALALQVSRLRIEAPVPGKGYVGIELPNPQAAIVRLREGMESAEFRAINHPLVVALGQNVAGRTIAVTLAKMPHLLIAGTTGSGKSVCIKGLITCLIANNPPERVKLVLIDPKRVEMIRFNGLPHLLGPTEVEGERIIGVLRWLVQEMEARYEAFSAVNARNINAFNQQRVAEGGEPLPFIVIFIDELADLMVQFSAETERMLCRLAQMARATGMHLVVATQRPSTDVITGLIKANFPARIAFAVASSIDSRVVLDSTGAEQLLGNGDMLFLSADASVPTRLQGCFVSEEEIDALLDYWQQHRPKTAEQKPPWEKVLARMKIVDETDDELERAIAICQQADTISTSLLQRKLRLGYPRAARLMEHLYEMGLVEDPKTGGKTRKTYINPEDGDPLDREPS